MSSPATEDSVATSSIDLQNVPKIVDWLVGAFLALLGLSLFAGGSAVTFLVDRAFVASRITDDVVGVEGLSNAEVVDIAVPTVTWAGYGLVLSGLVVLGAGVAFVVLRRRSRAGPTDSGSSLAFTTGILGATVATVLSILPFSPAVGGAVAGYLEPGEARRAASVGALSGFLLTVPLLTVVLVTLPGFVAGLLTVTSSPVAVLAAVGVVVAIAIGAVTSATLGAAGGLVGGEIAGR